MSPSGGTAGGIVDGAAGVASWMGMASRLGMAWWLASLGLSDDALEAAGVEFSNGEEPDVRLRKERP